MEEKIKNRVKQAIQEKVFPGCVVGAVFQNGSRLVFPFGHFTYENNSSQVSNDTVYDVASVTKMIPTSSLLLSLIDQGKVSLGDKVQDYLSEFGNSPGKESVLLKHLLTYTLDIDVPSTTSLKNEPAQKIIDTMIKAPLKSKPGDKFIYTNSTALITGLVVTRISGLTLDIFADQCFFKPLSMAKTTFHPKFLGKSNVAPTEIDNWRGRMIQGEVHDEGSYVLQKDGYYLGAAGVFSTANDLLNFMEMLLNNGVYKGNRYFSENIVREMHTNQLINTQEEVGLGWDLNSKHKMGDLSSNQVFGHSGFTGSMVICDPILGVSVVILSNRTFPKRPVTGDAINSFRHDIADIVFGSL